jgi:predicted DCC family thiol-disulfide oxidoreductase YuxK
MVLLMLLLRVAGGTGSPALALHFAAPISHTMNTPRVTVWFDAACPLCAAEIRLLRRLDRPGAIAFIDVREDAAACPIDTEALLARFHAQEGDGALLSGAAAFAAMWRAIPLLRPFGLAARWPPLLKLLERMYLLFLRVRPRLQAVFAAR